MEMYIEQTISNGEVIEKQLKGVLASGEVKTIKDLKGKYNGTNGRVRTYIDTTFIDPQAVKTAEIRRQAQQQAGEQGNREQRARTVEAEYWRLFERMEMDSDNRNNIAG